MNNYSILLWPDQILAGVLPSVDVSLRSIVLVILFAKNPHAYGRTNGSWVFIILSKHKRKWPKPPGIQVPPIMNLQNIPHSYE